MADQTRQIQPNLAMRQCRESCNISGANEELATDDKWYLFNAEAAWIKRPYTSNYQE